MVTIFVAVFIVGGWLVCSLAVVVVPVVVAEDTAVRPSVSTVATTLVVEIEVLGEIVTSYWSTELEVPD